MQVTEVHIDRKDKKSKEYVKVIQEWEAPPGGENALHPRASALTKLSPA